MNLHALEAVLLGGTTGALRRLRWRDSLVVGARLGDGLRAMGVRRRVAEDNLARAIPGWSAPERARILRDHYREMGRIAAEYARLPELASAADGEVIARASGLEPIDAAVESGRGVVFVTGHFGNFELMGAWMARRYRIDLVVKPLHNPRTEAWIASQRAAANIHTLRSDVDVRRIYRTVRDGRSIALLGDQDARRAGVFVPFLGRPASTPAGPARIALATGVPIVTGFIVREADGRHAIEMEPPRHVSAAAGDTVESVTAWYTSRLEAWVRRHPHNWFWLHRRWKTQPPPPPQLSKTGG